MWALKGLVQGYIKSVACTELCWADLVFNQERAHWARVQPPKDPIIVRQIVVRATYLTRRMFKFYVKQTFGDTMTQKTFLASLPNAIRLATLAAVVAVASGCATPDTTEAPAAPALESDAQKASYTIGYRYSEGILGQARAEFGDSIDNEAFLAGVRDLLDGIDIRLTEEDSMAAFEALAESKQATAAGDAATALAEESAWLAENGAKDGIITTDSGLQYEILTEADGAKPGPTDQVTTHYEGRHLDGTVFDSSYERDDPSTFGLNQVIPGWTEALQLMSPGAKYRLYVPSALAYGPQGRPSIPPNSTLIFDVELISIGDDS